MLQPFLYTGVTAGDAAAGFRDITKGNNGAYHAKAGWDACTGLGAPNGPALLERLSDLPRRPWALPRGAVSRAVPARAARPSRRAAARP